MFGVALLLLGSCAREVSTGGADIIPNGKMKVSVKLDKLTRTGSTRAEVQSEDGEDKVNSLYLLFFDGSDNGGGIFKGYTEVNMPEVDPETNTGGSYSMNLEAVITYPAGVDSSGDYSILALANISDNVYIRGDVDEWMEQWEGRNESYVISHSTAIIPAGSFSNSQLLMRGSQRKPAGDNQVHMLLKRDVVRLDVTKGPGFTDWDITTVAVWNSYPETFIWDSGRMDYTENALRVRRHYAVSPNTDAGNIKGGLYAFENHVGKPLDNDKISTCLVVGLRPSDGSGDIEYFRVNLHDETGTQSLIRNHVYTLLIEGKDGVGAKTEETAYLGDSNKLIYNIGDWEQDMNGLIVRDEYSSIGIPTKTVVMGAKATTAELKILTFSSLPSPSSLKIRSQTYTPATNNVPENEFPNKSPIWAHLDGNTLVIESTDLEGLETERSGVIILSYAGLEIAINVSQAGEHDNFLIVTEPDGGILPFAAYAGIPSGLIRVQASGNWTAKLYLTGFSFDSSQASDPVKMIWTNTAAPGEEEYTFTDGRGYNTTTGMIIPDEVDPNVDKFRIYTHSHNMGQTFREGIIVIELDGMEEDYSATIMVTQNYVKNLHYVHSAGNPANEDERVTSGGTITFDGMGGVPKTGSYAGNNDWWYVFSGYEEDSTRILPWSAQMVLAGGADDRNHFEIIREGDVNESTGLPYENATNYHATELGNNKVRIRAKGMNISGRDYKVTLRVQTDPGTFADIEVVQQSASFELSPSGLLNNKVSNLGGTSDKISLVVENGGSLKWKINSPSDITFSETATKSHTRHLVHYGEYKPESGRANEPVTLVIVDEYGSPTGDVFAYGQEYDINKSFRVKFPQIYFPNRDIEVTASVTVTVNSTGATSGGMRQTVRVAQNALTARPVQARTATTGNGYGGIYGTYSSYSRVYKDALAYMAGDTGGSLNTAAVVGTPLASNINYVHRTNWNNVANDAISLSALMPLVGDGANQGVLFLMGSYQSGAGDTNARNFSSLGRGWAFHGTGTDDDGSANYAGAAATKIGEFIFNRVGTLKITGALSPNFNTTGNNDHSYATNYPDSAVPFMWEMGGGSITSAKPKAIIVIDPKDRIMFVGEDEMYANGNSTTVDNHFITNSFFWQAYAAQYGSGFSDLLVDDETANGGGMPAPWDEWWGANKIEHFDNYNY